MLRFSDIPFGIISQIRNFLYDTGALPAYRSALPVICVGNVSLGGNGKTPLVLYLTDLLQKNGRKPVVLSRGYGGSIGGPHLVSDQDSADKVGDESVMLQRKLHCPVVVSRKRVTGAKLIEQQSLGDIIILDDGFQHRALNRNLDILCVFAGSNKSINSFRKGRMFPFGRFRESREAGLRRAQAVMFNSRSLDPVPDLLFLELKNEMPKHLQVFRSHLLIDEILSLEANYGSDISDPENKEATRLTPNQSIAVDVLCGLAQPEAFFSSLESFGLKIERRHVFRDHYSYSERDIMNVVAQSDGRPVVCSEKDAVKLETFNVKSFFVARTSLIVEPKEEFLRFVLGTC